MERLTTIEQGCCIACFECNDKNDDCGCPEIDKCLHRLRDYEDTGLTPEEIMNGKMLAGWIPVEERLPEPGSEVLTYIKHNYAEDGWRAYRVYEFTDHWVGMGNLCEVIAWMLLPEPYRPETLRREAGTEAGKDTAAQVLQSAT